MSKLCYTCQKAFKTEDHYGLHLDCFLHSFGLSQNFDFENITRQTSGQDSPGPIISSFFHGTFKKYSAQLAGLNYILKVREQDYPELPFVEYLSNQIAVLLGLKVADFFLIDFFEAPCFVSRNFLHQFDHGNLIHIYHYLKAGQKFNCQTILDIIKTQTGRGFEMERFVHLTLFDALIGNHDRHGRNLALIKTSSGTVLSPFYDNPSYIGIEEYSFLAADLSTKGAVATADTQEPQMSDYVSEFIRLNFSHCVQDFNVSVDLKQINACIEQSFLSQKRKAAFTKLIAKNHKELQHALQ